MREAGFEADQKWTIVFLPPSGNCVADEAESEIEGASAPISRELLFKGIAEVRKVAKAKERIKLLDFTIK